jgi:gliding motility-associated protein GldM
MAGVKESPRQKMINMMYLVLTAMLALQVSNALLLKFLTLNNSVEKANNSAKESNERTKEGIVKKINEPGGANYQDVLVKAKQVRKLSDDMIAYVDDLKQKIVNDAGGGIDPETGSIKNLSEEEKVAQFLIGSGGSKSGKAYELKNKLNTFTTDLAKFMAPNTKLAPLALEPSEDPSIPKNDVNKGKDFAAFNFEQTPVPAALATLSQQQSEVRRLEGEALDYLAGLVGLKEIKFDEIFAVVIPDSRTVVVGQTYKAEVAIGAYSKSITPRISINGSGVPIKDGKGIYEIPRVGGGEFDKNGQLKRSYTATVSYPDPSGQMKTVTKDESYTVLKPSVSIATASLPALYFKCANRIQTASSLGSLFSPTFGGSGAEFIPGGSGKVTIIPNAAKVSLEVKNDGLLLESFPFNVKRVPRPTVRVLANGGAPANEKSGESASGLRTLVGQAISDQSFKETNPEDAKFRVAEMEINLARGTRRVGNMSGSGTVNISQLAQQAQAGDRYVIVIKKVERMNFKGEIETYDFDTIIQIPLK